MSAPRPRTRHGLNAVKARVRVQGLQAIDARTASARALLDWRRDLIRDLGGDDAISAQQRSLVELATRTRLYIDHADSFLMAQRSLVNARRRSLIPLVKERQTLVDSLSRILAQLGLERRKPPAQSLHDVLREIEREKAAAGAQDGPGAATGPDPHPGPSDEAASATAPERGPEAGR